MREIKFRAWNKRHNVMIYDVQKGEDFSIRLDMEDQEVMQYTGLNDKDDKEIYEGDIVQFFNDEDYILTPGRAEVCFDLGAFCMKHFKYGTETLREMDIDDMFIRVIGNIYENPELLKE